MGEAEDKIRDKIIKHKEVMMNLAQYEFIDDVGRRKKLGTLQIRILNDIGIHGFKIYKSPSRQLGAGYRNSLRNLKKHGHMVRLFHYKFKPRFTIIYYAHKAREAVQGIYAKHPEFAKRPAHMKTIEVPIMKNLNKLGSITKWKHLQRHGKLNDTQKNSYGNNQLDERKPNKWDKCINTDEDKKSEFSLNTKVNKNGR